MKSQKKMAINYFIVASMLGEDKLSMSNCKNRHLIEQNENR